MTTKYAEDFEMLAIIARMLAKLIRDHHGKALRPDMLVIIQHAHTLQALIEKYGHDH